MGAGGEGKRGPCLTTHGEKQVKVGQEWVHLVDAGSVAFRRLQGTGLGVQVRRGYCSQSGHLCPSQLLSKDTPESFGVLASSADSQALASVPLPTEVSGPWFQEQLVDEDS